MINRVISHENIQRAMIYDVENSMLYSNIYSQMKKIEKSLKTRYSRISTRKKITIKNISKIKYTKRIRTNTYIKNIEKNQITIIYFVFTK